MNVGKVGNLNVYNTSSVKGNEQAAQGIGESGGQPAAGKISEVNGQKDSLHISPQARLANKVSGFATELEKLPDIRPEKVEAARQALASGELHTEQAAWEAAEAILGQS